MADPTIQTFCCHRPNRTDSPVDLLMEFHSNDYNTVCLVSSIFGIVGAIYQLLPRRNAELLERLPNYARGRNIIKCLARADLLASLGVFLRSSLWINYNDLMPAVNDTLGSVVFCAVSSAWIQFFYTATWFWTLCYAYDMRWILKSHRRVGIIGETHITSYYILSYVCPAVLTLSGLSILYLPNANCHSLNTLTGVLLHILPNYCATYLPMICIMIANPILYWLASKDVEYYLTVTRRQYTQRERKEIDAIKKKYLFFTLVFYLCWLPNLINGILLWSLWINLPRQIIIVLWYLMAVVNPLQALFNSLVYQKWNVEEEVYIPCCRLNCMTGTQNEEQLSSLPTGSMWLKIGLQNCLFPAIHPNFKVQEEHSNDVFLFNLNKV